MPCIRKVSPRSERWKGQLLECLSALNRFETEGRSLRHIIPSEDEVTSAAQGVVALDKCGLSLRRWFQPPTKSAVAEHYIEFARLEMFRGLFERSDDMIAGPILCLASIRLNCPEVLAGEKLSLIMRCEDGTAHKQNLREFTIVGVKREDQLLQYRAIYSMKWSRHSQNSSNGANRITVFGDAIDELLPSGIRLPLHRQSMDPILNPLQHALPPIQ